MESSRKYVLIVCGIVAACFTVVATLCIFVDPYFMFGSGVSDRFTPYKETMPEVIAKAELARKIDYDTIYLGSSRAEVGLDPLSAFHGGTACFNAGLPACKPAEALGMLQIALKNQNIKHVYLMLDFLIVRQEESPSFDYLISRANPDVDVIEYRLLGLFGYRALDDSITTLENYVKDKVKAAPESALRGHYDMGWDLEDATALALLEKTARQYFDPGRGYYGTLRYSRDSLNFVEEIANECAGRGIQLTLMTPPLHVVMYEAMHELDIWTTFEQMKRDVVEIVSQSPGEIAFWDFSGYTRYTTEPIARDEHSDLPQWFYEPSHFKPSLGDLLLQQIQGMPLEHPPGLQLTTANIDAHLLKIRRDREAWAGKYPDEAERVRALVRREAKTE